jgi:steroid delta-isomerase-like uncharacterized protein
MAEDNRSIIDRFERAFAANDTDVIEELCDADLVDHDPLPDQKPGLVGFKETIAFYKTVFPDSELDLQAVIVEGDQVATRWTVSGTHKEEFFGIPATGKRVKAEGMNFYTLSGGKITDVWTQFDGLGLMEQLGA